MEEKIKIYISKSTADILNKDAELFEFFKQNGTVNRNAFLNTLIVNYIDRYQLLRNSMTSAIEQETGSDGEAVMKILDRFQLSDSGMKTDTVISVKPTKQSSASIAYIQECLLKNSTLSGYFRTMFASYALLPRNEREKIIFKPVYDALSKAIENQKMIWFTTKSRGKFRHTASPYMVTSSKEELFNYLLCEYNGSPYSFRMSRISAVFTLNRDSVIQPEVRSRLERMLEYGPQFAIRSDDEIRVRLTDAGIRNFQSFFIHRPVPCRIEGNVYIFRCSEDQIMNYFTRFGQTAVIESPAGLRRRAEQFFRNACRSYRSSAVINSGQTEDDS